MHTKLEPKLITVFKEGYSFKKLYDDAIAGVIVGIVALPLAIAFAIASGVKPEQGLYTAVIAGFIISVLSGSRVQIGGPTGAFIVIVYGIIQKYGYDGLATATFLAGIMLIILGFARFGSLIKFIPYPVTVGFTSGIALIIFSSEMRDFFGLKMESVPAEFVDKWQSYLHAAPSWNFYATLIATLSVVLILFWPKITRKIPGSLIAILLGTAVVYYFKLPVETIGSRFGEVPNSFPSPHFPAISFELVKKMISPAFTIAMLAGIESLLSAVVADGMTGSRHRSNMELIAQGVANIVSPLFGGIPATGAIARTATNIKNGGKSPIAGIIHALTLLLIMLFFGKWASLIPMPVLAAILVVVAYNMSEWEVFLEILKSPRSDVAILLITFLLTVFIDLTVAIEVGMVLSVLLFMKHMAEAANVNVITKEFNDSDELPDPNSIKNRQIPSGVEVFEINGPLFFGAASKFRDEMRKIAKAPKVRIIRMRNVLNIDATGLRTIKDFYDDSKKQGTTLLLSGVHTQPLYAMVQCGHLDLFGEQNVLGNIDDALDRARDILGLPKLGRPKDFVATVEREMKPK